MLTGAAAIVWLSFTLCANPVGELCSGKAWLTIRQDDVAGFVRSENNDVRLCVRGRSVCDVRILWPRNDATLRKYIEVGDRPTTRLTE